MATTRNGHFKSVPRLPTKGPSNWRGNVDPWFLEFARLFKQDVERRAVTRKMHVAKPGQAQENSSLTGEFAVFQEVVFRALFEHRTIREMFGLLAALPIDDCRENFLCFLQCTNVGPEVLEMNGLEMFRNTISLLRYQITFAELRWKEKTGDRKAGEQMVKVEHLCNQLMHGQLPRSAIRFKGHTEHIILMLLGLRDGLQDLRPCELADFFDAICPCGKTQGAVHSPEVLRRLRRRLEGVLERCAESITSLATDLIPESFYMQRKARLHAVRAGIQPGTYVAMSRNQERIVGTGQTSKEAFEGAMRSGESRPFIVYR